MHILIIEDEDGIASFLEQGLEEEGFRVTIATDGESGLAKACENNADLILLDWMLPKIEGVAVCKEARKKGINTPIIFLTAKDTVEETIEGLKAGANDYIKKPFSFEELLERIKIHFRDKKEDILHLGNIKLNKTKYKVEIEDKEIGLTQREFELLEYLIRNKGKVCTRDKIIEEVWNINFDYNSGVIDVFINAIRKKLYLTKEDGCIRTIRGVGYIANEQ